VIRKIYPVNGQVIIEEKILDKEWFSYTIITNVCGNVCEPLMKRYDV
jgi:hypothetical protein